MLDFRKFFRGSGHWCRIFTIGSKFFLKLLLIKLQMDKSFVLTADFTPQGDQPEAIKKLCQSIRKGNPYQTLLGVTGSGKTFSIANVIEQLQRPALILSHNKTLAAQLFSEFKAFFPENAVEYFVSYYDYYQPEAYIPQTDTYIEKDSSINEDIERHRIAASSSLLSRKDVIVVASISCIYGLGSPEDFKELRIVLQTGQELGREVLLEQLVGIQYQRNEVELKRGTFRVRGETVDIYPAYMQSALRIEFWGEEIEAIYPLDPLTGNTEAPIEHFEVYPANQYIAPQDRLRTAVVKIQEEMKDQIAFFEKNNRLIEAQRIKMRTEYDLELLQEMGFCTGIENYSRHIGGRKAGERPFCLLDFFPKDFLLFVDESHVTLPQVRGMYLGDRSRKERLIEHGFRLPSALDNRPLKPEEFTEVTGQTIYVSATPGELEITQSPVVAEQLIRPTGLLDPEMCVKPIKGQVEDFIAECEQAINAGERVLATTLTKRMSEDITEFLREKGFSVEYLHSDIDAIERVEVLRRLREGKCSVLVGVNLLREGLDLPEVALVVILDADKEGFLRSKTSLIQTAGRAARHENGRVILYADVITKSLKEMMAVCQYRRKKQIAYNEAHQITPKSVKRGIQKSLQPYVQKEEESPLLAAEIDSQEAKVIIAKLEEEMQQASQNLQFEKAAILRDQIQLLKGDPMQTKINKKRTRYSRR